MENLMVDKFTNDLKEMIDVKKELMAKRDALSESLKNGRAYFSKRLTGAPAKELDNGAKRMHQLISDYEAITKEINDMDLVIISSIEAYTANFVARVRTAHKINDAGDIGEARDLHLVPFVSNNSNLVQITPDDIWFLKMVKEAYKPSNITFIDKDEF